MVDERPLSERPAAVPSRPQLAAEPTGPLAAKQPAAPKHSNLKTILWAGVVVIGIAAMTFFQTLPERGDTTPTRTPGQIFVETVRTGHPAAWVGESDAQIEAAGRTICTTIKNGQAPNTAIMALIVEATKSPERSAIAHSIGAAVATLCPEYNDAFQSIVG